MFDYDHVCREAHLLALDGGIRVFDYYDTPPNRDQLTELEARLNREGDPNGRAYTIDLRGGLLTVTLTIWGGD